MSDDFAGQNSWLATPSGTASASLWAFPLLSKTVYAWNQTCIYITSTDQLMQNLNQS